MRVDAEGRSSMPLPTRPAPPTQATASGSLESVQATRLVIAHRLSAVRKADRIVVLIAGTIAQTGTYEQLIALEGPFADLAQRQLA